MGDIATEDIRVQRTIHYVNESETSAEKERVAETVKIVFDKDPDILQDHLRHIDELFNAAVKTLSETPAISTEDLSFQLTAFKRKLDNPRAYPEWVLLELLSYKNLKSLQNTVNKILIYVYDNDEMGMLHKEYDNPLDIDNRNIVIRTIRGPDETEEVSRQLNQLKTIREIWERAYNISYSIAPYMSKKTLSAVATIVRKNLQANLQFNPEETQRRIDARVQQVKPVMGMLKKGQTIVREGDTITGDIKNRIEIVNRHAESTHYYYILGVFLMQVLFFFIFAYIIIEYYQFFFPDNRSTWIIFSLIIMFIVYTFFVSRAVNMMNSKLVFALLLPIPFVTMMLSILYNLYISIMVGGYLIFFTAIISGADISSILIAFSSAILGIIVNKNVNSRTDFLRGGLILGIVNSLLLVTIALIDEISFAHVSQNIQLALANGFINSILVVGMLPLYENVFGITTRFKLLELSDLNADIFKKMLVKAPGTYNHSLIVSTMAEAACKEINADAMLARVGAFYHDIGKIQDAGMYIENKVTDPRASMLSFRDYSQLIISHVSKGVILGRQVGLPESIIDFIREHHGKSIMNYFYHQALEESDSSKSGDEIKRSDFQYPGPKPHRKETAIVMLADSIEAASRTVKEPTAQKLEGLVKKIVYNKLNEGDLEYSDLSMSELNRIQRSFLNILNGIFHTRIEYPDAEEVQKLEKKVLKEHGNHD